MVQIYYVAFVESIIYIFNKLQHFLQSVSQCSLLSALQEDSSCDIIMSYKQTSHHCSDVIYEHVTLRKPQRG